MRSAAEEALPGTTGSRFFTRRAFGFFAHPAFGLFRARQPVFHAPDIWFFRAPGHPVFRAPGHPVFCAPGIWAFPRPSIRFFTHPAFGLFRARQPAFSIPGIRVFICKTVEKQLPLHCFAV
jgi:hypothetical protein